MKKQIPTITQHTPGPWKAVSTLQGARIQSEDCTPIVEDGYDLDPNNARLIAAAPDLLEALKMCADFISRAHGGEGMTEEDRWALLVEARGEARAAIAKATK